MAFWNKKGEGWFVGSLPAAIVTASLTAKAIGDVAGPIFNAVKELPGVTGGVERAIKAIQGIPPEVASDEPGSSMGFIRKIPLIGNKIPGPLATLIEVQLYHKVGKNIPNMAANAKHHAGRLGRWLLHRPAPTPDREPNLWDFRTDLPTMEQFNWPENTDPNLIDAICQHSKKVSEIQLADYRGVTEANLGILDEAKSAALAKAKAKLGFLADLDTSTLLGIAAFTVVFSAFGYGTYLIFFKKGLVIKAKAGVLLKSQQEIILQQQAALDSSTAALAKYELLGGKAIGAVAGYEAATSSVSTAVTTFFLPALSVLGVCIIAYLWNKNQLATAPYNPDKRYNVVDVDYESAVDVESSLALPAPKVVGANAKPAATMVQKIMDLSRADAAAGLIKEKEDNKRLREQLKASQAAVAKSDADKKDAEIARLAKLEAAKTARQAKKDVPTP